VHQLGRSLPTFAELYGVNIDISLATAARTVIMDWQAQSNLFQATEYQI